MPFMNERVIFYAVPKTGSSWCVRALPGLTLVGAHHGTPADVPKEDRAARFQFCFVRHPLDWLRSFWCDRIQSFGRTGPNTKALLAAGPAFYPPDHLLAPTFDGFCRNVVNAYPRGYVSQLYQSYVGPYADELAFVGRQEKLADHLDVALLMAGEQRPVRPEGRLNAASEDMKAKAAVIGDETRRRVMLAEGWAMGTFGYGRT